MIRWSEFETVRAATTYFFGFFRPVGGFGDFFLGFGGVSNNRSTVLRNSGSFFGSDFLESAMTDEEWQMPEPSRKLSDEHYKLIGMKVCLLHNTADFGVLAGSMVVVQNVLVNDAGRYLLGRPIGRLGHSSGR